MATATAPIDMTDETEWSTSHPVALALGHATEQSARAAASVRRAVRSGSDNAPALGIDFARAPAGCALIISVRPQGPAKPLGTGADL